MGYDLPKCISTSSVEGGILRWGPLWERRRRGIVKQRIDDERDDYSKRRLRSCNMIRAIYASLLPCNRDDHLRYVTCFDLLRLTPLFQPRGLESWRSRTRFWSTSWQVCDRDVLTLNQVQRKNEDCNMNVVGR